MCGDDGDVRARTTRLIYLERQRGPAAYPREVWGPGRGRQRTNGGALSLYSDRRQRRSVVKWLALSPGPQPLYDNFFRLAKDLDEVGPSVFGQGTRT